MNYFQQSLFTNQQTYSCVIENGVIYSINLTTGERMQIGVDNATINDSVELAEKYYNRLVEIGDIILPKTQEEINQELLLTIKALNDKIEKLEGVNTNEHKPSSKNARGGSKPSKPSNTDEQ